MFYIRVQDPSQVLDNVPAAKVNRLSATNIHLASPQVLNGWHALEV
jgi:hypothetical protein